MGFTAGSLVHHFFLYAMSHAVSPLLPLIIDELKIAYWLGGLLYSIPPVVVVFLSYPLGIVLDRVGFEKSIICGALAAIVFGSLRGFSRGVTSLLILTVLFGTGLTFCFVSLPKFIRKYFPVKLLALAMGVYTTGITVGSGTGISLTRSIIEYLAIKWEGIFFFWGIAAVPALLFLAALLFFHQKRREEPGFSASTFHENGIFLPVGLRKNLKTVLKGGILFFLLNLVFFDFRLAAYIFGGKGMGPGNLPWPHQRLYSLKFPSF